MRRRLRVSHAGRHPTGRSEKETTRYWGGVSLAALIPEAGQALKLKHFPCCPSLPLMDLTVSSCLHMWEYVELISFANRVTSCWPPVAELRGALHWQERTLLTNDFCFSPYGSAQLLFCGSLPAEREFLHQSRKVKRFAGKCSSYSS